MYIIRSPVEAPMAPMSTAGTAMIIHPREAFRDNIRAFTGVLQQHTLKVDLPWKATANLDTKNVASK